jgi:hypothetical protein
VINFHQEHVSQELRNLQNVHHNIRAWESCGESTCSADNEDVWTQSDAQARFRHNRLLRPSDPRRDSAYVWQDTSLPEQSLKSRRRTPKRKAPRVKSGAGTTRTEPASDPDALQQWLQRTVGERLTRFRKAELLAGYRLHNCLVAAEQDNRTVRVRILQPKKLITTIGGAAPARTADASAGVGISLPSSPPLPPPPHLSPPPFPPELSPPALPRLRLHGELVLLPRGGGGDGRLRQHGPGRVERPAHPH